MNTPILPEDLQARLNSIIQTVPNFWKHKIYRHFTNHGTSHSKRVHELLSCLVDELPLDKQLNPIEWFTLSAAAWLYEIGMQSPNLLSVLGFEYIQGREISLERLQEIREKKNLLSSELIYDSVRREYKGLPLQFGLLHSPNNDIPVIAEVCRWCCNESLDLVPEFHVVNGSQVRIRLLVALLRLADQLYIDGSRIDLDILKEIKLPDKQLALWWAFQYVQTLPIENGQIRFNYTLPVSQKEYLSDLRNLIELDFGYDQNPIVRYLWDECHFHIMPHRNPGLLTTPSGVQPGLCQELLLFLHIKQYLEEGYDFKEAPYYDREFILIKAWDKKLKRLVAIKTPRLDIDMMIVKPKELQNRLLNEAQILSRLKHPGLVGVYSTTPMPFSIVQEWIHDTSLQDMLDQKRELSLREILEIGVNLASVLEYLHKQEIIHRNLKPSNVMLTEDGKVILVDFSIARVDQFPDISQRPDGSYGFVGTPNYSAPEQIQSPEHIRNAVDIFALGVILYELLTGKLPFEYGNNSLLYPDGHLPVPNSRDIPKSLYDVLLSALEEMSENRPTAAELYYQLLSYSKSLESEDVA